MADTKHPHGVQDLYGILGLQGSEPTESANPAPEILPVVDLPTAPQSEPVLQSQLITEEKKSEYKLPPKKDPLENPVKGDMQKKQMVHHDKDTNTVTLNVSPVFESLNLGKFTKNIAPYLAIFVTLFFFYLVVFTNFSISSFFSSVKDVKPQTQQKVVQAQTFTVPKEQQSAYTKWINSYFFDVTDPKIVDPNTDLSGNGLTNYQKFLLGLNPKRADSMGLGMTDTEALISGIDPLTGKQLTDDQKKQIASIVDLEGVANKLALNTASLSGQVAGASINTSENRDVISIDTSKNAELSIPKLNITVPLIWSKSADVLLNDLVNGVVHYPGTAMPGEIGTSYISGHSSNYVWDKGKYNNIFAKINDLQQYDSVSIKATQTNGKEITFHYVVTAKDIFKADDQKQFANIGKSTIALSTCWPIGTSSKRLVVFAQLSQISK